MMGRIFRMATRRRKNLLLLLTLLGVYPAITAFGAEPQTAIFQKAADEVGVPVALTQAIARVESRGNPYALNVEGQSFFFNTREEALSAARTAEAEGRSFDCGIMQINNWWLKRYGLPLEALWEPDANILLGSWILKQALAQSGGDTWRAVGIYHSPNATRGKQYAAQVRRAMERGPLPVAKKQAVHQPKPVNTTRRSARAIGSAVGGAVLAESERPAFVQRRPIQTAASYTEAPRPLRRIPAQAAPAQNDPVYATPERPVQARSSMVVYRANQTPVFQRTPAFETSANADGAFERNYE